MTAELTCPKCRGAMASYERNGVHVDQCQDCRGLFLDRGELERLVDAEAAFNRHQPPPAPTAPPAPAGRPAFRENYRDDYREDYRRQQGHGYHGGDHHRRKRRSFLEELFD